MGENDKWTGRGSDSMALRNGVRGSSLAGSTSERTRNNDGGFARGLHVAGAGGIDVEDDDFFRSRFGALLLRQQPSLGSSSDGSSIDRGGGTISYGRTDGS